MLLVHAYLWCLASTITEKLRAPRRGQGLVEYGLIIALIAAAGILGLAFLAPRIQAALQNVGKTYLPTPCPTLTGGTPAAC